MPIFTSSQNPADLDPLLGSLKSPLNGFLSQIVLAQTSAERTNQLAIMRRNHLYYEGKQYLTTTNTAGQLDYKPVTPGGSLGPAFSQQGQVYDYVLNILKGDIWKFVAVLGSRSPNVTAQARDSKDEMHNVRRMTADRIASALHSHWKMDELATYICMILAKYGTAFSYCRYTTDQQRAGTTDLPLPGTPEPSLSMVDASGSGTYQCPNCGTETPENAALAFDPSGPMCMGCATPLGPESLLPAEPAMAPQAMMSYPNGICDLDIATAATVTAPWWTGRQISDLPWLLYQFKEDKGKLAQAIPEYGQRLRLDMAQTPMVNPSEAYTQDQLKSPTGLPSYAFQTNISQGLYGRLFLQPWSYEYIPGDASGNIRQQLLDNFRDGAMVTFVNNEPVKVEARRLAAHWAVCQATPSESLYSPAYFEEYIQGQDVINDLWNFIVESAERSIPLNLITKDLVDADVLRNHAASPGEFMMVKPGVGTDISKMVHRLQAANIDPDSINLISAYIERLRENHGILPALWGAANDPTARQTDVNRNQALQMLTTPWNALRGFISRTMENGVMELATNSFTEKVYLANGIAGRVESLEIPGLLDLAEGGWYFDTDPNIPMTSGQRRDWVMNLLDKVGQSPELASFLGLAHPENLKRFQETMGIDWYVPGVDERMRVLETIHRLLQGAPIESPPELDPFTMQPMGPPPPPEPSIPYDPSFFNPALDLDVLKEWLMSDEGMQAEATNPQGFSNVIAWGHTVLSANQPPVEPPPPPRLSVSAKLSEMVPEQEAAVLDKFGLPYSGGTAGPGGPPPIPGTSPGMPPGLEPGGGDLGGSIAPPPPPLDGSNSMPSAPPPDEFLQ